MMSSYNMILLQMLLCNLFDNGRSVAYGNLRVRVNVPQFKVHGEVTQFQCEYNLDEDSLYSVKWYKDNEEFYRYVPRRKPVATSFKVEGVNVDMNASDSKRVILKSVGLNTTGMFRCEVSAEGPSFASAQSEARMEVLYLPIEGPNISGMKSQYQLEDEVHLNCTSGKSYPVSTLRWYINDKQVISKEDLIRYHHVKNKRGLITSILGLRFISKKYHFVGGFMTLKCISSLWPSPWNDVKDNNLQTLHSRETKEAILIVKCSSASNLVQFGLVLFLESIILLNVIV